MHRMASKYLMISEFSNIRNMTRSSGIPFYLFFTRVNLYETLEIADNRSHIHEHLVYKSIRTFKRITAFARALGASNFSPVASTEKEKGKGLTAEVRVYDR